MARRTEQVVKDLATKQDKKPPIDVLVSTLELTGPERLAAEDGIRRGQQQMLDVLATPTWDGDVLLDEVVETAAQGMATPGRGPEWAPLFARLVSEKVPGGDLTYAARIEAIKSATRERLRAAWRPEAYEEFVAWGVDPLEVKGIEGSPTQALEARIGARAAALAPR